MIEAWIYKLPGFQKCSVLARYRKLFSCCKSQTSVARKGCKNFLKDTVTTSVFRAAYSVLKPGKPSPAFQTSGVLRTVGNNPSPGGVKNENQPQTSSTEDVHSHQTITILQRLHDLEQSFNYRGYSVLRWGFISTIVLGFAIYVFREPLRENVADEVADVATRSLADENVIQKADEVTRAVLQDVLRDAEITKLASAFVMQVLQREDVKAAAIQLTQHVLHDPSTLQQIAELAKGTLIDLLKNEETRVLLLGYIKSLILDDSTRNASKSLLQELVKDPEVKSFMAASLGDLVTSTVVRNSAVELGKTVTHQVVNDATIQQETGNALWDVVKKTLTPGWFGYESK